MNFFASSYGEDAYGSQFLRPGPADYQLDRRLSPGRSSERRNPQNQMVGEGCIACEGVI